MHRSFRRSFATFASSVLVGTVLVTLSGCGAVSSMANPKVAWALQDPAPMSVVVRRAEVAESTVKQVDRLLTATPLGGGASDWLAKVGLDPDVAADALKSAGAEPMYAESHARVVDAEAWARVLPRVGGGRGRYPSLLAAIAPDLAASYTDIASKRAEIAALAALIDDAKADLEKTDLSTSERAEHQTALTNLQKMRDDSEADVAPLTKAFLDAAGDAAARLPAEQKAHLAPAMGALIKALADADVANSAAAVRFPLAMTSLPGSVKAAVPGIVAKIVEQKTGKKLALTKLTVDVTLHGTDVDVTLDGVGKDELGSLSLEDLQKETVVRTAQWALHAMRILTTVSATKNAIAFQSEALEKIRSGLGSDADATGGSASSQLATGFVSLSVTGTLPAGAAAGAAKAGLSPSGRLGVDAPGVTASVKVPGARGSAASSALSFAGSAAAMAKDPKGAVTDLAKDAATSAAKKIPGGSAVLALGGTAASFARDPKGAATDLAKDAAGAALKKVPGGAAALALGGSLAGAAKDPKGAAADLAKNGAASVLGKVPVPGGLKVGLGFGKQ